MKFICVQPFNLETTHGKVTLSKGRVLELSPDQAGKLKKYIKPLAEEAVQLLGEIGKRDPGGDCWLWIQSNRPDLWRKHIAGMLSDDIETVRATFDQMLTAWGTRHEMKQADLLTA